MEVARGNWKIWAALATIYVVWGSTYLGIKIAVRTQPPLLSGGARFLAAGPHPELLPGPETGDRGHFLTFRLPDAAAVHAALHAAGVIADYRDDRLRLGFGLYHGEEDVDELLRRLATIPNWP